MTVRKRYFPKALMAMIAFGLAFSLISTASATLISGVPYHAQTKWYYCGPGCLEMMFDFYGPDISQTEIADAARTDLAYAGTYTDDMRRAAHFSDLSTSQGNEMPGSVTGYTARGLGYAAFTRYFTGISQLKTPIDAGYPIIVLTAGDADKDWGHFRVVIGYDDALSEITMQDPLFGANYKLSYTTFDDWWNSWSGRWGMFTQPWNVVVTAPASVSQGSTFSVSATVTYPCPSPFSAAYPASSSQATIQLPAGLSLAVGETATKTLGTGTMVGGGSASVNWNVDASSAGSYAIPVEAEGQVSGSVSTHGTNTGYSYTDRIGGTSSASVTVTGVGPQPPVASFTESAHTAPAPALITFNPSGSTDDGTIVLYEWDFDGDGVYDHSTATPDIASHTYTTPGTYIVTLRVTDDDGLTDTATDTKNITPIGVIPEVPLGTIMASAAMIIALVAYVAMPKWRRKPI